MKRSKYCLMILLYLMTFKINSLCAQDAVEKIKPKLRLNFVAQQGKYEINANAYYIEEGEKSFCEGAVVDFYTDEDMEKIFRKDTIDADGKAHLILNQEEIKNFEESPGHFHFYAQLEENEKYRSRDEDLYITNADIEVSFLDQDTARFVKATFRGYNDSAKALVPVDKIPLKCYVKRSLSMLPFGGRFTYTDSNGQAIIQFPDDINGDEKGEVSIVVMLDDYDDYGTVKFQGEKPWGLPTELKNPVGERTLIGARDNAPLFMIISINLILVGIWGFLFYVIFSLIRIRRIGKQLNNE